MKNAAAIATELVRTYGYEIEDLILDSSKKDEGIISLIERDSISYPIDTKPVCERMVSDRTSVCIITDGTNIHIFERDGVSIVEVDRLRPKGISGNKVAETDHLKSRLWSIMEGLRGKVSPSEMISDLMVMLAMAVIADEREMWDDLESGSVEEWDSCLDTASVLLEGSPAYVKRYKGEYSRSIYLTPFLRFRDLKVSQPSSDLVKIILDFVSRPSRESFFTIPDGVCRMLLSLSFGRTEYNGIGTIMMGIESTNSGHQVDLLGFYEPYFGLLSRISGIVCPFTSISEYPRTIYDTILTCPPIGMRLDANTGMKFMSKTSESMAIESALSRISSGGRVCAIVPSGFLFSMREEKVRDMISKNYRITAIIELERPFDFTSINMNLLILDSRERASTIISKNPIKVSESMVSSLISALDGDVDDRLFMQVEQASIGKIWTPSTIVSEASMSEKDSSGVPISYVAEVIRGCNIPSSRYHPDGSLTGIPYLRISNIKDGIIDLTDAKRVSSQDGKVFSKEGDVVISIQGTIGKVAESGDRIFIPSAQVALVRPNLGVNSEDLASSMESEYFRKQLNANITGTVIKSLSIRNLVSLKVIIDCPRIDPFNGDDHNDL